jgi:hypothetical protein
MSPPPSPASTIECTSEEYDGIRWAAHQTHSLLLPTALQLQAMSQIGGIQDELSQTKESPVEREERNKGWLARAA